MPLNSHLTDQLPSFCLSPPSKLPAIWLRGLSVWTQAWAEGHECCPRGSSSSHYKLINWHSHSHLASLELASLGERTLWQKLQGLVALAVFGSPQAAGREPLAAGAAAAFWALAAGARLWTTPGSQWPSPSRTTLAPSSNIPSYTHCPLRVPNTSTLLLRRWRQHSNTFPHMASQLMMET